MIDYPCIIKHADDAELVYVASQSELDTDADIQYFDYDESDCLIDSSGDVYLLSKEDGPVKPVASGNSLSLVDILGLVKAHAALKGSCCVAKLYAPTIREAFRIVESLNEA